MYRIKAGDSLIYDSTNKYDYPCIEPTLNLELGEAGNLEFTLLPGHPLHDAIEEMQTFVSAYQDDDLLFDGRVLQAEEDTFGQVRCTCEGALTFLLDSEMEPETYTETIREFFNRCIDAHNSQVEARKQFSVGNVVHEEKDAKLEFKLEGYNKTREVLNNLLISKHGGFLQVRYENGQRYLDYIQHYTKTTNQPIKIGYNVIDKTKHVSGENMFTILRPLGKNNLTIEGASSDNLMKSPSIVNGKYLGEIGGDRNVPDEEWMHTSAFISVTPGTTYIYGPGEMRILCYDEDKHYMTTLEPGKAYEVTIPLTVEGFENEIAYVRLAYNKAYNSKIVFKEPGNSLISGSSGVQGKILTYTDSGIDDPDYAAEDGAYDEWDNYEELEPVEIILQNRERVQDAEGWNYDSTIFSVSAGSQYLATPGLVSANFYKPDKDGNYECFDMYRSTDNIGGDIFTVPAEATGMRLSYSNRFGSAMRVELYSGDNLASRSSGASGKLIGCKRDKEEDDGAWCYTSNYIEVEENTYYTGGPSQIKVCFYDEDKYLISVEEANREGLTMHYVRSPQGAKYARISFLAQYAGEQQFQKGKALILTKLDKGTKTILLPERIARYGQIIHSENFSEITDPQELYNAAIEWVSLHHSMLPASLDYSIVDFHLLNPEIEMFELGDVYDNIEGFEDESLTIGSLSKNMENPANDTLTLKNLAELMGPDAGKSSGSLSSKYAASSSGGGSGGNSGGSSGSSSEEEEETIPKDILIKSLESIGIEAPYIRLLAEERDGLKAQIDLIAKGKDGNQSSISLTDSAVDINSENIILEAKNLYNIADHVVTIADTVFTHANLIWNEAKDIVTIAENMYILTDHLTVVADTIDIIANDINILARNIRITADRMDLKIGELNADIGTINADIGTINATIGTINADIGTINADIGTINTNIGTLNANIGEANVNIGTLTTQIGELNADIGDATVRIDNLDLFVDNATTNFNTLTTEIGELNAWVDEADITIGTLNTSIESLTADIDDAEVNIGTLTTSVGTLNASVDELELAVGSMLINGDEITINGNSVKIGSVIDDEVTGGMIVSKINELDGSDTTVTKIKGDLVYVQATDLASWGVFTDDTLTAGVIAEKLTGKEQGNKTALQLLGDEIDISGNTTISGFLTVTDTVTGKDFIINKDVKLGTSGSPISLSNAVVGVSKNGNQVTFSFANGGSEVINFKSADSFELTGGWSNGAFVVDMVDASGGSTAYHTASSGRIESKLNNSQIAAALNSSSSHAVSVDIEDSTYEETLVTLRIDASGVYQQGLEDATTTPRNVHSLEKITLASTDTGSSVSIPGVTVFYDDDDEGTVDVVIDASAVYAAGLANGTGTPRSVSSVDAITLSGDHTSDDSVSITGTYTDGNPFASSVSIDTNAIVLKYYNMGFERAWALACGCMSVNGNKIKGPDPNSPGNSMEYYTISAGARSDGVIYWANTNFARHDFTGIAYINSNSVAETPGSQANAMPK